MNNVTSSYLYLIDQVTQTNQVLCWQPNEGIISGIGNMMVIDQYNNPIDYLMVAITDINTNQDMIFQFNYRKNILLAKKVNINKSKKMTNYQKRLVAAANK